MGDTPSSLSLPTAKSETHPYKLESAPGHGLTSSWKVRAAAGDPVAAVRLKKLSTAVAVAQDAWGRENKPQPVLVSAEIFLAAPFDAAAADDSLGADTVHYGSLSKTVLASLEEELFPPRASLRNVLESVWAGLTGLRVDGRPAGRADEQELDGGRPKAFLPLARVRFLAVTICLPKGSLLGEGVSLTGSAVWETCNGLITVDVYGLLLKLHGLRVPSLVGVNAHERRSRQLVVANVELDMFDYLPDLYTVAESLVVQTMDTSSFDTLEALATNVADTIVAWSNRELGRCWPIRVKLAKPTALPFADCPEVEVKVGTCAPRLHTS